MTNEIIRRLVSAFNKNKIDTQKNASALHHSDLKLAKEIQQQFIPKHPIAINNYKISSLYLPSNQLSGDFFDYVDLGDNKIGVLVIDVIGKGIKASFTTILIKAIFQQVITLKNPRTPKDMMMELNKELYRQISLNTKGGYGFYGVLDTKKNTLSYCHCGIGVASLYRGMNKIELEKYGGVGIGIIENTQYTEGIIELSKNDIIFISTDGIGDAKDKAGNRFGVNWFDSIITTHRKGSVEKPLIDQIEYQIKRKTGYKNYFEDDIACVFIEFYPLYG